MSSKINNKFLQVIFLLLSISISFFLWYSVVASNHTEMEIEVRLEYKNFPSQFVLKNKLPNSFTARLFGSEELLKNTRSKQVVYSMDLSNVQRGANSLDIEINKLENFTPFKILDFSPSRILVEADAITEKVVPLESHLIPLPENSPYTVTSVTLNPAIVTVKGPESVITSLNHLLVVFDPSKDISVGLHESSVAISAPESAEISPPLTNIHYTLEQKTVSISLIKQVDTGQLPDKISISPQHVMVDLLVPEKNSEDPDFLESVKVKISPVNFNDVTDSKEVPLITQLPPSAKLVKVYPTSIRIINNIQKSVIGSQFEISPFSQPGKYDTRLNDLPFMKKFNFENKEFPEFDSTDSQEIDLDSNLPKISDHLSPDNKENVIQPLTPNSGQVIFPLNSGSDLPHKLKSTGKEIMDQSKIYVPSHESLDQSDSNLPKE